MKLFLFLIVCIIHYANSLHCIQCDKHSGWYSEEEHEKHVEACQQGAIVPTKCQNSSHTHCIVSWYRNGGASVRTVTERKCGGPEDATGCTIYNSKIIQRKVRRHLINRDTDFGSDISKPRESAVVFVEVCSEACPNGDCINHTSKSYNFLITSLSIAFFLRNIIF